MMDNIGYALATDLDGAFPTVVKQMGTRLYWGLRRISADHQEAEDLTQETFIRAYKALGAYDSRRIREMKLESWLWTIALNLGRNHVRDRSRRPIWVELEDTGTDDPEIADGQAWDQRLGCLNQHQRTAVVLRHVIGMGIPDITAATGRPAGTVKADIHRGLAKLKQVMEDET